MKKTYCDKCGKEFQAYGEPHPHKLTWRNVTAGVFDTGDEGAIASITLHGLNERPPSDLCKPCLLAIITEALNPSPPMALMHRCGVCQFEWRPLPKVTDGGCPRCGSFMFESFSRPEAACPAVGCFVAKKK